MKTTKKLNWGVFRMDCYKLPQAEKEAMWIKTFTDYGEALKFAHRYSEKAAIHLTHFAGD